MYIDPKVIESQIPVSPKGYKLLVAMPKLDERTKGGIIRPDLLRDAEQVASLMGFVLLMGSAAYKDEKKFPDGPYCEQGDWVMFRSYSGTRFKVGDQEFRLINDDTVEAVVADPSKIERA